MDSGFCVFFALVKLATFGVYGSAVIKKRRFWPKDIQGDAIDRHFKGKEIGFVDALPGLLEGQHCFKIFCMKEEDYIMKLMLTYGALRSVDEGETQRSVTENGQQVNKSFTTRSHSSTTSSTIIKSMTTIICATPPFHWKRELVQKTGKFVSCFMVILALVEVSARLAVAFFTKSPTMNQLEF
jgi:hypothetical protein